MARSLFFKEKGALISLLFLSFFGSHAQAPSDQSISYSCRATPLETVMNVVSKQSGYDFVYSSSIVDVSKPVSLTVKNKSIGEVLALIERQADVSFHLYDRHIVIKSNPRPAPVEMPQNKRRQMAVIQPTFRVSDSLLLTSTRKTIPLRMFDSQATQLESHLNKRIIELQQLLGANIPHNISKNYVNAINFSNRYNGWYASIGTYVGDLASGLEFQAGLKYLYGVFTPRWSAVHGFYGAYGIGNSLQLRGPFAINTMYIFSGYKDSQLVHHYRMGIPDGPDSRHSEINRHHQVKLGLRYSFNENLSLRAGPVFNYQTTVKQVSAVPSNNTTYGSIEYRPGYGNPNTGLTTLFYTNTTRVVDKWIGWDISLQYRINFYKKYY
jgi:hypothetical protein